MYDLTFTTSVSGGTARLTGVVGEDFYQQFVGSLLKLVNNGVVKGILVLFQPSTDIVGYLNDGKTYEVFTKVPVLAIQVC